jgi:geranylgeranyl pyrophosphate synthase
MIFMQEMKNLHLGQGMDLFWRDSSTCPSESQYLEMVNNKTGGLFRIMVRLMQLESSCSRYVHKARYTIYLIGVFTNGQVEIMFF